MTNRDFVKMFSAKKQAFLEDLYPHSKVDSAGHLVVLESFEKWLSNNTLTKSKDKTKSEALDFNDFATQVLHQANELLITNGINPYTFQSRSFKINTSWKCLKIYDTNQIFFRIGKTRPRKGPFKGKELLVIELVMDGNKKIFLHMLEKMEELEKALGQPLNRELPRAESTAKYRLRLVFPIEIAKQEIGRAHV